MSFIEYQNTHSGIQELAHAKISKLTEFKFIITDYQNIGSIQTFKPVLCSHTKCIQALFGLYMNIAH